MVDWAIYKANGQRLSEIYREFAQVRALIVGDLTLSSIIYALKSEREHERFGYGLVLETNSKKQWIYRTPGSAGLIATTCRSAGASVRLIGVAGKDKAGTYLRQQLKRNKIAPILITDQSRPTTERTRVYLISRPDLPTMPSSPEFRYDDISFDHLNPTIEETLIAGMLRELPWSNLLVVAEYGSNNITRKLVESIFAQDYTDPCVLVIHPRLNSMAKYQRLSKNNALARAVLCLDWEEACSTSNIRIERPDRAAVMDSLPELAEELLSAYEGFDGFAIRLGQFGAASIQRRRNAPRLADLHYFEVDPTIEQRAYRAVGCGAVFTAFLGIALAANAPLSDAVALANFTAGLKYERRAEQNVDPGDVVQAMRLGNRRVQGPSLIVSVGDREAEAISRIVRRHTERRRIFLQEATRTFPVDSSYLPIIAYDDKQRQELEQLANLIQTSSSTKRNVLACIFGPSRSGKTQIARSMHSAVARQGRLIQMNCAADKPEEVLQALSILQPGETLLLDELGQREAGAVRDAILHVLDKLKDETNDLLVLATTSTSPRELGHDVFNRLHGPFRVYALHEVRENLPYFLAARLHDINTRTATRVDAITEMALSAFLNYDYPTGLRDLNNFTDYAVSHAVNGVIKYNSLPDQLLDKTFGQDDIVIEFAF